MLDRITYGTFLVFGSACIIMVVYAVLCVPETKGVPLESIYKLFEGNIIAGATRDVVPRFSRAKHLANSSNEGRYRDDDDDGEDYDEEEGAGVGKDGGKSSHIERAGPAKLAAYGMNNAGAS
jgi:SP family sugar:H+ symporter-like MFS transporter